MGSYGSLHNRPYASWFLATAFPKTGTRAKSSAPLPAGVIYFSYYTSSRFFTTFLQLKNGGFVSFKSLLFHPVYYFSSLVFIPDPILFFFPLCNSSTSVNGNDYR
jgi:hypothetical protein